jgi:hypothetical protein
MQGSFLDNGFHLALQSSHALSNALETLHTETHLNGIHCNGATTTISASTTPTGYLHATSRCRGTRLGKRLLDKHPDLMCRNFMGTNEEIVAEDDIGTPNADGTHSETNGSEGSGSEGNGGEGNGGGGNGGGGNGGGGNGGGGNGSEGNNRKRLQAKQADKEYARFVCGGAHMRCLDQVWNMRDGSSNARYYTEKLQQYVNSRIESGMRQADSAGVPTPQGGTPAVGTEQPESLIDSNILKQYVKEISQANLALQDALDDSVEVGIVNEVVCSEVEVLSTIKSLKVLVPQLQGILNPTDDMLVIRFLRRHKLIQSYFGSAVGAVYACNMSMRPVVRPSKASMKNMHAVAGMQVKILIDRLKTHAAQLARDLTKAMLEAGRDNIDCWYTLDYYTSAGT